MKFLKQWSMVTAATAVLVLSNVVWAAPPATTISITDLECKSCAKKVAARLSEVPGVETVQTDVEAKTATVTPKGLTVLSPRALWEAVERAGKTPIKLEGPGGTFTAKPQSLI